MNKTDIFKNINKYTKYLKNCIPTQTSKFVSITTFALSRINIYMQIQHDHSREVWLLKKTPIYKDAILGLIYK